MTKKLKSGTPFVYDENDRVVGIRDPHTGTDTDLVTAVMGPGGGLDFLRAQPRGLRRAQAGCGLFRRNPPQWRTLRGHSQT